MGRFDERLRASRFVALKTQETWQLLASLLDCGQRHGKHHYYYYLASSQRTEDLVLHIWQSGRGLPARSSGPLSNASDRR